MIRYGLLRFLEAAIESTSYIVNFLFSLVTSQWKLFSCNIIGVVCCWHIVKALDVDRCIGAIVCKLHIYQDNLIRGYIAMLAVDKAYRRRGIGMHFCVVIKTLTVSLTWIWFRKYLQAVFTVHGIIYWNR